MIREQKILIVDKMKGTIALLAGRELRTYLYSFVPEIPFDIMSEKVYVSQTSSDDFITLY